MITQEVVAEKILQYLNKEIALLELVHWSEDALVTFTEADEEVPNEKAIFNILGYLGAGDTPYFPFTWDVLSEFLEQLGVKVRVVAQ